ncbi:EAL domain-containing protein [Gallaecimonas kandeliae]|uniref:EAL domain-containing protein n=1 Tax=Gallaecimonas kandeliae TaxID=3029055 RepID=UPI00264956D7|nr:EAL domain-containing protein [Gallaecimonas kandeliae]WKE66010.1 EAL domain-containing protein [Gallaecimonas kandeliae]
MEKRLPFLGSTLLALALTLLGSWLMMSVLSHQQHDSHMLAKARQLARVTSLYPDLPPLPLWEALTADADVIEARLYVRGQLRLQSRHGQLPAGDRQFVELQLPGQRRLSLLFDRHPLPWAQLWPSFAPLLIGLVWLLQLSLMLGSRYRRLRLAVKGLEEASAKGQTKSEPLLPKTGELLASQQQRIHTLECQQRQMDSLLHSAAWLDAGTGLGNRLFFEQHLATWLQEMEGNRVGCLVLLEHKELADLDEAQSQAWRSQLLALMQDKLGQWPDAVLGRLDEDEYGLLLPQMAGKDGQLFAQQLLKDISRLPLPKGLDDGDWLHLGWSPYQAGDDSQALLEQAAMALRAAQLQGENAVMAAGVEGMPQLETGSVRWRTLLEQVLARHSLKLVTEPVHGLEGDLHHWRVRALILDPKGKEIDDSVFMPMACRVGQEEALSRLCLELLLAKLGAARARGQRLAFRICVDALLKPGLQRWLRLAMMEVRDALPNLLLTVTEFELAQHGQPLAEALKQLGALGAGIMVERLGQHPQPVDWQALAPRAIKLHSSLARHIDRNSEQQLWVQRLVQQAVDLNAEVLAAGITSNEERRCLLRLGVSGGEGPLFGRGAQDPL